MRSDKAGAVEFEAFFRSEYQRVFRCACLVAGSREIAMDATQEAFQRAYVRWRRLSREPWAGGWVLTTATNLCKRELERQRRADLVHVAGNEGAIYTSLDGSRIDTLRALRNLPFRQRQATVLYYLGDLPLPTIAHLMGVTEGAVKAHLAHARKALKRTMEVVDD